MDEASMDLAYQAARENHEAAELATFKILSSQFPTEDFDTIHQVSQRAMRLHIAAMDLARKIWAELIPYQKANEILRNQFPEFPGSTREKALSVAYTDTR